MQVRPNSLLAAYLGYEELDEEDLAEHAKNTEEDPEWTFETPGATKHVAKGLALMNQADDDDDQEAALVEHVCYIAANKYLES